FLYRRERLSGGGSVRKRPTGDEPRRYPRSAPKNAARRIGMPRSQPLQYVRSKFVDTDPRRPSPAGSAAEGKIPRMGCFDRFPDSAAVARSTFERVNLGLDPDAT